MPIWYVQTQISKNNPFNVDISYFDISNFLFFGTPIVKNIGGKDVPITDILNINQDIQNTVKGVRALFWFVLIQAIIELLLAVFWPSAVTAYRNLSTGNAGQVGGRRR